LAGRPLILASRSPQRKAILEMLGVPFEQVPADVEERVEGAPRDVVLENALRKARSVAVNRPDAVVLGVDTEVFLDGEVFGKAADWGHARAHLQRLSGRTHEVFSGIALIGPDREPTGVARTEVTFRDLGGGLLDWYLETGEWHDRAGAYAIQGRGAALVERIDGDYWNVVGLPVPLLLDMAPGLLPASETSLQ
jgi:septum formation protein